ncbi:hypothetical protein KY284_012952 [Solanum tuberosum]|nr:hypothetical protein KY284_012952 [Solanum tuberosum]
MGDRVLEERHEKNPVASIILFSIGRDTYNGDTLNQHIINQNLRSSKQILIPYLNRFPSSICSCNRQKAVYAFAMCIGGILSIVSQEFQLSCLATSPTRVSQLRHVGLFPLVLSPTDVIVSLDVDRQINWIEVTEAIQEA